MYIHVKVMAGAKAEKIEQIDQTHYKIWVKEKAKANSANRRVLEIMKAELAKSDLKNIRIINGHHSPSKLLSVS